jgi:hypothetical protein
MSVIFIEWPCINDKRKSEWEPIILFFYIQKIAAVLINLSERLDKYN